MKQIPLTQGKFALVDDEDFERVNQYSWQYLPIRSLGYAKTNSAISGNSARRNFTMHRFIMNFPEGKVIDHVDGNGLNNQKSNLRICTNSQNLANQSKQRSNTSGFKGVSWHKSRKVWVGHISYNNKAIHVGSFSTAIEAARAFDRKARELFGEFAKLNFPKGQTNK